MGAWVHCLSEIDADARSAICAACGPTKIRLFGAGRWRCSSKVARGRYPKTPWPARLLSEEEFERCLQEQGGVCAICKGPPTAFGKYCLDHDHQTNKARGVLCSKCNSAIGLLGDDPEVVDSAAAYLRKHRP